MQARSVDAAAPPPRADAGPVGVVQHFVRALLDVYQGSHQSERRIDDHAAEPTLASLRLADAALHALAGRQWPPQIAVIGPTQTGKSSIVNALLGRAAAEASPLAGFTIHPQGFRVSPQPVDEPWLDALLPHHTRVAGSDLKRDALAAYAVTPVEPAATGDLLDPVVRDAVVWDTPDFDSLSAHAYAAGVLAVAAIADVHVLVLSKEKYADRSAWSFIDLVAPLRRPLVICLNKMTPDSEGVITASLRERLAAHAETLGAPPIIALPYVPADDAGARRFAPAVVNPLRQAVLEAIDRPEGHRRHVDPAGAARLIRAHWDAWLAPVRAEQAALRDWENMISAAGDAFIAAYRRDYLEHPQRYDSFRRAALAVLGLIELPAVGAAVAKVRQIVTWPARQLFAAGKSVLRPRTETRAQHSLGVEAGVLTDAWNAQFTALQRDVGRLATRRTREARWWAALADALDAQRDTLAHQVTDAIETHHTRVSAEIDIAARQLFDALRKDPSRLAIAQGARASIDVASVLLAIKTGGLSMLDAVWAPAAFALSSLLLEHIADLEMKRTNATLKARQLDAVRDTLLPAAMQAPLLNAARFVHAPDLFNVDETDVAAASAALRELEAGRV